VKIIALFIDHHDLELTTYEGILSKSIARIHAAIQLSIQGILSRELVENLGKGHSKFTLTEDGKEILKEVIKKLRM
jgi:hypothetical protein